MIRIIAFLGNYGSEYTDTRHNAGFFCAAHLELTKNLLWKNKFDGEYAKIDRPHSDEVLHFLKPLTYMNNSGIAVSKLMQFFKIKPAELLVVHDELELAPATISLKWSGGLGGHNGLRSIKAQLGTADFWRLRIGIGRPAYEHADIADYVLSRFSPPELENLQIQLAPLNTLFDELVRRHNDEELKSLIPTWAKRPCMPTER